MYIVYTIITVRHNQNYKAKQLQIYAAYYNDRFIIYKNIFREHSASCWYIIIDCTIQF